MTHSSEITSHGAMTHKPMVPTRKGSRDSDKDRVKLTTEKTSHGILPATHSVPISVAASFGAMVIVGVIICICRRQRQLKRKIGNLERQISNRAALGNCLFSLIKCCV